MQGNLSTVLLCGGVGGARMAQGFAQLLGPGDLMVIVNVGDDDTIYGADVSADLDTVLYTLAGIQGPEGWGIADDTFVVMEHLAGMGVDTTFRLGDRDLSLCLARTAALREGEPLSEVTTRVTAGLGVPTRLVPASNDRVRTRIQVEDGTWLSFQDYFVRRGHSDRVVDLAFEGAPTARPAPGVVEAIGAADLVVIAPSNPPLSIWPILAIPGLRPAIASARLVIAVSPLFGGRALKGPAAEVMRDLGLPPGTAGVLAAYAGLITDLVIDQQDVTHVDRPRTDPVRVHAADTRIATSAASARLAAELLAIAASHPAAPAGSPR